jgi:pimeloyl-ACP methyl ester carboxylesterase
VADPRPLTIEGAPALHAWEWRAAPLPPVLLLHGAAQQARVWDGVAERLALFHAVALDARGHGRSEAPGAGHYTAEDYVADVLRVLDRLDAPVALIGHSTGALVAMIVAARYPERLWAAAFIDIDPRPPDSQRERLREAGSRPPRRFASLEEVTAGVERLAPGIAAEDARRLAETGYERAADGTYGQRLDPLTLAEFPAFDNRALLPRILVPALVVRGEESTVSSETAAREAVAALPQGELRTLPGAHQLHLQHPAALGDALREFLGRHTVGASG